MTSVAAGPRLGLGTAQFGMVYGIANSGGRVSEPEAAAILDRAAAADIALLDTAPAYGEAEALLGRLHATARFRIVTKTPHFGPGYGDGDATAAVAQSRTRLCTAVLDTVLIHHPEDVRAPHANAILDELLALKARGSIRHVGLSVYGRDDLDAFGRLDELDVVQLPLSLFDQRALRDGTLDLLRAHGVEIHIRSVFLQGLALMPPDAPPSYFDPVRPLLRRFHDDAAASGLDPLAAALGFVRHLDQPAVILVGVESRLQFDAIQAAWAAAPALDGDRYAGAPVEFIDPRHWPRLH